MTTEYEKQTRVGKEQAIRLIEDCRSTGNLPRLVREIRTMSSDTSPIAIGWLHVLAELAMHGVKSAGRVEG